MASNDPNSAAIISNTKSSEYPVLAAAAVTPLNERCEFQIGDFIEEVKRRAKRDKA